MHYRSLPPPKSGRCASNCDLESSSVDRLQDAKDAFFKAMQAIVTGLVILNVVLFATGQILEHIFVSKGEVMNSVKYGDVDEVGILFSGVLSTMTEYSLEKTGWVQVAFDGAIILNASVSTNVFTVLFLAFLLSFLDYFGVLVPKTMVLRLKPCTWLSSLALVISLFAHVMQAHRRNGGWQFDNSSGAANEK